MHRSVLHFSLALALASGTTLVGQAPPPVPQQPITQPPATQPEPKMPTTAQAGDTMLTGCLRSSRADTSTADSKGNVFTLEVTEAGATKPSPSPEAGAPSRPMAASKTTYTLSAAESLGLAKHVNHEVQVTGSMQGASTMAGRPQSSTPAEGAKPMPGGGHRTFQVSALKMISANCP